MTAEQILKEMLAERGIKGFDRTDKIHIDTTEEFIAEFSQKLRNASESSANTSDDRKYQTEDLVSKIESLVDLITNRMLDNSDRENVEECYKLSELFDELKTHINTVSLTDNNPVEENINLIETSCKTALKQSLKPFMQKILISSADSDETCERLLNLFYDNVSYSDEQSVIK